MIDCIAMTLSQYEFFVHNKPFLSRNLQWRKRSEMPLSIQPLFYSSTSTRSSSIQPILALIIQLCLMIVFVESPIHKLVFTLHIVRELQAKIRKLRTILHQAENRSDRYLLAVQCLIPG